MKERRILIPVEQYNSDLPVKVSFTRSDGTPLNIYLGLNDQRPIIGPARCEGKVTNLYVPYTPTERIEAHFSWVQEDGQERSFDQGFDIPELNEEHLSNSEEA